VTLETALLLVALGLGVGGFGTLLGAGGGFILTPLLLLLYPGDSAQTITAMSLAVVFFNAGSGTLAYARQRRVDFRSGILFALATLPGAVVGALLVGFVARRPFDIVMAFVLLASAAWLMASRRGRPRGSGRPGTRSPRRLTDRGGETYEYEVPVRRGIAYSLGVGLASSFLGIGGGILHVPLLVRSLGFPTHVATATSHFVLAIMAATGTATHLAGGSFAHGAGLHRVAALSVGVVVGAQLGAVASRRVSGVLIEWLLALGLAALAVWLLISA
jgi:uncharacterized membrane protein YfcA